ncbi:hypothetical protein ACJJTC_000165 [Scirpophaga incertulas]
MCVKKKLGWLQRRVRYSEARARALRARADYALSLEAANAALQRYCLDDVVDVMMDAEIRALIDGTDEVTETESAGGPGAAAAAATATAAGAEDAADEEAARVRAELRQRADQLAASARLLRAECRENAKTLDAAEAALVRQMAGGDEHWDVSKLFAAAAPAGPNWRAEWGHCPTLPALPVDTEPLRDQEDYYLAKFRAYASCAGRLARMEARMAAARRLCGAGGAGGAGAAGAAVADGDGDEELDADGDWEEESADGSPVGGWGRARGRASLPADATLPPLVTSCVRLIATHGLRHQGIFRVSGSQVEMQALRAAFARGEDPLAARGRGGRGGAGRADVHAVCGLLKQFLRELAPPLVPPRQLAALLAAGALPDGPGARRALARALRRLPPPSLLLLRYLCAFLHHVARTPATRMDAWNLAVCLGPSLLPAATAADHAALQHHARANQLVARAILHHRDLFPQLPAPHALYVPPPPPPVEDGEEDELDGDHGDPHHHLALYDDDEISEDGESGEWREPAENR